LDGAAARGGWLRPRPPRFALRHSGLPSSPGPSHPTGTPSTPAVPAGYKLVSYRDIEVAVPRALKVTHSPCFPPVNAVYAATDEAYSCPAPLPGNGRPLPKTAVGVWLASPGEVTEPVSARPEPTGHRSVSGVEVTVRAPTRAEVNAILNTIRTVAVDRLGCPAQPASIIPSGQPPAAELVPGDATSAVVCDYSAIGTDHAYVLAGSSRLPSASIAPLAAVIDGLPARARAVKNPITVEYDWIRFRYPSGATRIVAVPTNYAPTYITDGNRIVVDHNPGIDLIPLLPDE
jgi:hypothetical protein